MYKTALENAYKIKAPGIKKIMMQFLVGSVVKNTNDTSFSTGYIVHLALSQEINITSAGR
jgi:hypothetical protein